MTSTRVMFKKPKSVLRRVVNVLLAAVLMLAGPALMITSYQQVDADEELARTGVHVTGIITYFSDARKASNRDITVEYVAADGVNRYANAPVDHEQHPPLAGRSPSPIGNKTLTKQSCSAMEATANFWGVSA